jgi:hypothetical protein
MKLQGDMRRKTLSKEKMTQMVYSQSRWVWSTSPIGKGLKLSSFFILLS